MRSKAACSVAFGRLQPFHGVSWNLPPGEVHSRMMQWASTGDVWAKRWGLEPLPSEDQLLSPEAAPCAISGPGAREVRMLWWGR